ncbi:MAG: hypothetical protein ACUVQ4_04370 [bacterium]
MAFIIFLIISQVDSNQIYTEIQIPFDTERTIYEIGYPLLHQLDFFREYQDAQKVQLFLQPDSSFILEIYEKIDSSIKKKRIKMSTEDISRIQEQIELIKAQERLKVVYDRSGYRNFLYSSFVFAYAVQAPLIVMSLGPDDYRTGVAIYMLTSAAGFAIPLMLTKNCDVSKAHASMFFGGGTHGLYIAGALSTIAGISVWKKGPGGFITVCGSVIGEYTGFQAVNRYNLNMGRGNTIFLFGDFAGVGAAGMLSLVDNWSNPQFDVKHYLSISVLGFGTGVFFGASATKNLELADGDSYIFGHCGILGGLALPITLSWADRKEDGRISGKMYVSAGLAGLGLGSVIGYKIVREKDFTESDGNIITLGGAAGALTGAGLVFLANIQDRRAYYTGLLIGDIAGSLATASIIEAGKSDTHSRLHIHPEGVLGLGLSYIYQIPSKHSIISINF